MHVGMYVCIHACMYVCMFAYMKGRLTVSTHNSIWIFTVDKSTGLSCMTIRPLLFNVLWSFTDASASSST